MSAQLPFELPDDWEYDESLLMDLPMDQVAKLAKSLPNFERHEAGVFLTLSRQLKAVGVKISPKGISKLTHGQLQVLAGVDDELELEEDDDLDDLEVE